MVADSCELVGLLSPQVNEKFYRNGVLIYTTPNAALIDTNQLVLLKGFSGELDEIRIYLASSATGGGGILSQIEITRGYQFNVWPGTITSAPYLKAYWPLSDQGGGTITDYSGNGNHITGAPFGGTYTWKSGPTNNPMCLPVLNTPAAPTSPNCQPIANGQYTVSTTICARFRPISSTVLVFATLLMFLSCFSCLFLGYMRTTETVTFTSLFTGDSTAFFVLCCRRSMLMVSSLLCHRCSVRSRRRRQRWLVVYCMPVEARRDPGGFSDRHG
jgi:hypothetical protein